MNEADFQRRVMDAAQWHGWRVHHSRPARTAQGWRTPLSGDAGCPDLILARRGRLILAELKGPRGVLTLAQERWLGELGEHGKLWRPADWSEVRELLTQEDR